MEAAELRRLIVRHRHVAPMLSVLLASTDARVTITSTSGELILDRQMGAAPADAPVERHPIIVEGSTVGWVDGPRPSGAIAAVLLDLDFPATMIKAIPLLARTGGLLAHLAEEQARPIGFLMASHAEEAIAYDGGDGA